MNEGCNESESCEASCTDRKAFTDCGSGISYDVEGVCDFAGFITHLGHFCDATCVIGNWAVSIDSHSDADSAEHSDCGEPNAVKTGAFVGTVKCCSNGEDRENDGLKSD